MARSPAHAWLRFHGELNDHLPPERKGAEIEKQFFVSPSVKDMIESLGVPHTEVDVILINGEAADFARLVHQGDRIEVYPAGAAISIPADMHMMPPPIGEPRFQLDVHLGRLAGYLRMLGFDAAYATHAADAELVRIALAQDRILLTRDRGLLRHAAVKRGYWLRHTDSRMQTAEVVRRYRLAPLFRPFTRCMVCNQLLLQSSKSEVDKGVPVDVLETSAELRECPGCGRVYWEGSHTRRMRGWIEELRRESPSASAAAP